MSDDRSVVGDKGVPGNGPPLVRYVYWGAASGMLSALAVLLALTVYFGSGVTDSLTDCAVFAGTFTVLLSQPVAFVGLLAGAVTGTVVGLIARRTRHFHFAT